MIVRTGVPISGVGFNWHRWSSFLSLDTIGLTNGTELQHDAGLDYYGRRLATCSSDKTIKIFEIEGESHRLVETLKG